MKNYWVYFKDGTKMVVSAENAKKARAKFVTDIGIADIRELNAKERKELIIL